MDKKKIRSFIKERIAYVWPEYKGLQKIVSHPDDIRKLAEVIEEKLGQLRWTNYTKTHLINSLNSWVDHYVTEQLKKRGYLKDHK
jgi:hypothetical protein